MGRIFRHLVLFRDGAFFTNQIMGWTMNGKKEEKTISEERKTAIKKDLFERYYGLSWDDYAKMAEDGAPESEQGTIWRLYGIAGTHVDEMIQHMFLRIAELEDEAVGANELVSDLRARLAS